VGTCITFWITSLHCSVCIICPYAHHAYNHVHYHHTSWPAHHNQGLMPCALFHQCIGYRICALRHCKHWSHGCINKLQQHIYTISCHIVSSISWHVGIFIIYHGIKQVCIFLKQISTPLNKRTLSKNALRKPCLRHIIRSQDEKEIPQVVVELILLFSMLRMSQCNYSVKDLKLMIPLLLDYYMRWTSDSRWVEPDLPYANFHRFLFSLQGILTFHTRLLTRISGRDSF